MKYIINLILIIVCSSAFGQSKLYFTAEANAGTFKTSFKNPTYSSPLIENQNDHFFLQGSLGLLVKWDKLSVETGIGEGMRIWKLEGQTTTNQEFSLKHKQFYPTVYVGGYFEQFITNQFGELNAYIGGRVSADFIDYKAIDNAKGNDNDYVSSTTTESNKVNFNASPEIGIKSYLSSGNYFQIGVNYSLPLNGEFLEGEVKHFTNRNDFPDKIGSYKVEGQSLSLVLKYGFALGK